MGRPSIWQHFTTHETLRLTGHDQLGANYDLLSVRSELLKQYHDIHSVETRESIQKAKIKWAVEGDENSKFFHGMINRKRANVFNPTSERVRDLMICWPPTQRDSVTLMRSSAYVPVALSESACLSPLAQSDFPVWQSHSSVLASTPLSPALII
ncbi:hypothetical protein Tco_1338353 [Tanacetum coccineum]